MEVTYLAMQNMVMNSRAKEGGKGENSMIKINTNDCVLPNNVHR